MKEKHAKRMRGAKKAAVWALACCLLAGCGKREEPQETLSKEESGESASTLAGTEGDSGLGDTKTFGESTDKEISQEKGGALPGESNPIVYNPDVVEKGSEENTAQSGAVFIPPAIKPVLQDEDAEAQVPKDPAADEYADFKIQGDTLLAYQGAAQQVVVPDGVKIIGKQAFYNNSSLLSVELPDGVTTIGDAAFDGCKSLKDIAVPDSLTVIGSKAFSGCHALEHMDLQSVRQIGSYAFYECCALTSVSLSALEKIQSGAFSGSGLNEVNGMEKLGKIGESVFDKTPFFRNYEEAQGTGLFIRNHILIFGVGSREELEIPQGVRAVAPGAFQTQNALRTVIFPESIEEIGVEAFGWNSLKTVYMPQKDIELGKDALGRYDRNEMEIFPLSGKNEKGWDSDFLVAGSTLIAYRGNGSNIVIPEGIKVIGEDVFGENTELVSVCLPEGVTEIRSGAFAFCAGLQSVSMPPTLQLIREEAFWNCFALKEIDLQYVQEIDENAFCACDSLENVNLSSVKTIGQQAFAFSGVKQIAGMGQLSVLGAEAFGGTPFGEADTNGMKIVGNVLFSGQNCTGDIAIPKGVEIIADNAFEGAQVTSVACPDTLRIIGAKAFYRCPVLNKFSMGDSVVSLGGYAFYGDGALSDIRLSKGLEAIPETAFLECENLRMLTIPQGCDLDGFRFGTYRLFQEERRLLTLPPTAEVPEFLRDSQSGEHKVYTTKIPNADWISASQKYGWSLSLLELAADELVLWEGEEHFLVFNSGAKADWRSDDETVVSVDQDGRLAAAHAGETDVTAEIYGEEYRCHVIVR